MVIIKAWKKFRPEWDSLCEFIIIPSIAEATSDQLPVGLIAHLAEYCTGITEVMGTNPVQVWIFFRL